VLVVWRRDAFYSPIHIAISYELITEQSFIISLTAKMEEILTAKISIQSEMTSRY
jgi:hypothetical protein